MIRSFIFGNFLEGGSFLDLFIIDFLSIEKRDNFVFIIFLILEMVRNIIVIGKLKKDYLKFSKEVLGDEVFSIKNRVMEGD